MFAGVPAAYAHVHALLYPVDRVYTLHTHSSPYT